MDQQGPADPRPEPQRSSSEDRFEVICGVLLAIFAAILAWADVGGSNVAEDRSLSSDSQTSAYAWYQSKGIKQALAEGQRDTLAGLLIAGSFTAAQAPGVTVQLKDLDAQIKRYDKEKAEILKGSQAVGKENWTQDVAGEMGKIIGADEYKARVEQLNAIDNIYDNAGLFMQLCLVMGALSLVFKFMPLRLSFLGASILLGAYGFFQAIRGFLAYSAMS